MSGAQHPYVGMWVTEDGSIRHELLVDGRYDEARNGREHAYQGCYRVTRSHVDYTDDSGFTADGDFVDIDVLHHAGMILKREVNSVGHRDGEVAMASRPAPEQATADETRYQRGLAQLEAVSGPHGTKVVESLADIAPDLGRYIVEFAYGDIFARPGLDLKTRELATVAALSAMGTAAPQLKVHMQAALQVGASREEIIETIIQMVPYAGFPSALNAVAIAREVFAAE